MYLTHRQSILAGIEALDVDIRHLEIVQLGGVSFLLAATGRSGGLSSYRLGPDGAAGAVAGMQVFSGTGAPTSGGMLVAAVSGNAAAITLGSYANTNAYRVTLTATGALTGGGTIAGSSGITALAAHELVGGPAFYTVSSQTGQLQRAGATASGHLDVSSLTGAGPTLAGVTDIGIAWSGGQSFLLASSHTTDAIGSYRIDAATGGVTSSGSIGAEQGLGIGTPTAFETVTAFGQTWVILGAAGSSSLSVLSLSPTGTLGAVDHVMDTLETRFGRVTSVGALSVGDRVFIVAGGADDGLSLFTLLPGGRLLHLESLAAATGTGLMNVEAIELAMIGSRLQIFVSSGASRGVSRLEVDLSRLGAISRGDLGPAASLTGGALDDLMIAGTNDTLNGGAGDDILVGAAGARLTGGAGRDLFVLADGHSGARILDFDPAFDRLDLSGFAMLRGPDQVTLSPASWGARLRIGSTTLDLRSADGGRLERSDIFGPFFSWPDRIPVLERTEPPAPPLLPGEGVSRLGTPGPDLLEGDAWNDTLDGGSGNDTLRGSTGDDILIGGDGNDRLEGGAGDDWMGGNAGDDLMIGTDGADTLVGHDGRDTLRGDIGADVLRGEAGNDTLEGGEGDDRLYGDGGRDSLDAGDGADLAFGGDGDDTIEGGGGNDTLYGDDGDDEIFGGDGSDGVWGDIGNDTLHGGAGNDTLGGFLGDDVFHGGAGNDVVWGNAGDDWGWGGAGNDTLGGGDHRDRLFGEEGNDLVWGGSGDDTLSGGEGVDTVGGFVGDDIMHGDDGDDFVWGNSGHDTLYGDDGNDLLGGGDGDDVLHGGRGHDELRGGPGNDVNIGGDGADTFYFRFRDSGFDRIRDFERGIDMIHIDVSPVAFEGLQIWQWNHDTVIELHNGQVILEDMMMSHLTADHFIFG
ncbi:hypothetical protein [Roseovarius aquimarinus]|uniref:Ca2+-binding protein, RTX toxin-related n=1 Tax=Roseovarius aquimarinus TaxID=1229156 RepID=A0ABW7IAB1_9RHOB